MKELFNNPGFIALMGTMFGGAGLELIRRWMDRRARKDDEAAKQRAELRVEIEGLRGQLDKATAEEHRLEAEIERWKGLYYDQKEEYLKAITDLKIITASLKNYDNQFNPTGIKITEATAKTATDARDALDTDETP